MRIEIAPVGDRLCPREAGDEIDAVTTTVHCYSSGHIRHREQGGEVLEHEHALGSDRACRKVVDGRRHIGEPLERERRIESSDPYER